MDKITNTKRAPMAMTKAEARRYWAAFALAGFGLLTLLAMTLADLHRSCH